MNNNTTNVPGEPSSMNKQSLFARPVFDPQPNMARENAVAYRRQTDLELGQKLHTPENEVPHLKSPLSCSNNPVRPQEIQPLLFSTDINPRLRFGLPVIVESSSARPMYDVDPILDSMANMDECPPLAM